jgi:hypothetical protein
MLRPVRRQDAAGLWVCVLLGCAAPAPTGPTTPGSAGRPPDQGASVAPLDPRSFARGATFDALLIRTQALLLTPSEAGSDSGCVLQQSGERIGLGAELLAAVDPLPDASAELAERLERSVRPVRVLTAWGETNPPATSDLALAAFTALDASSRRLPFAVLFVTARGAYLRYGQRFAELQDGPLDASALQVRLDALSRREPYVLYVTADAALPLTDLYATLATLADAQPTALAVLLPEGTVLPTPPVPDGAARLACPGGLPEPAADAVEGELSAAQVLGALDPLRSAAQGCLEHAAGAAAAGGKLVLGLRIDENGVPSALCLIEDGIGDAVLASCVVESARALRLPRPEPAGFVDVHVPLQLSPLSRAPTRPVCR